MIINTAFVTFIILIQMFNAQNVLIIRKENPQTKVKTADSPR